LSLSGYPVGYPPRGMVYDPVTGYLYASQGWMGYTGEGENLLVISPLNVHRAHYGIPSIGYHEIIVTVVAVSLLVPFYFFLTRRRKLLHPESSSAP
jgi:hypothetical protein